MPDLMDACSVSPPSGIDAVSRYGWIPGKILETLYLDDPETK